MEGPSPPRPIAMVRLVGSRSASAGSERANFRRCDRSRNTTFTLPGSGLIMSALAHRAAPRQSPVLGLNWNP
jgi:hypothetical protein